MSLSIPPCFYRVSMKALILDTNGQFLLCKEKDGIWDLPGGGLDEGENISDGLKREIKEEMGLDITILAPQPSYFFKFIGKNGKEKINVLYLTSVKDYNFTHSDECVEIQFFNKESIKNLDVYPNVQEFLKIYNPENHVHH